MCFVFYWIKNIHIHYYILFTAFAISGSFLDCKAEFLIVMNEYEQRICITSFPYGKYNINSYMKRLLTIHEFMQLDAYKEFYTYIERSKKRKLSKLLEWKNLPHTHNINVYIT